MIRDPLIVALDVESLAEARKLVGSLGEEASFYKVGMELYAAAGMDVVRELIGQGKRVFLDLKLYDIGETVKRATAQIARSGADFLTVHANAGLVKAAAEGRGDSNLKILAVTVLTSFDERDLRDDGYSGSVQDLVRRRVASAQLAGVDGIVASALEAAVIREQVGPDLLVVTPGVRSKGAAAGDQKRVATPAEALRNGANYVVVGRQVTRAADPMMALRGIRSEIGMLSPA